MAPIIFNYGHKCACTTGVDVHSTKPTSDAVLFACQDLIISDESLNDISVQVEVSISNALNPENDYPTSLKSYAWHFDELPNGTERGKYLALDLPGRNFNVVMVELMEARKINVIEKQFAIPKELMLGPGEEMFDFVAECIEKFVKKQGIDGQELAMGFTFVPETKHVKVNEAIIEKLTNGFLCTGCIGKDVVKMLQDAIDKRGTLMITVEIFLNETIGALMSGAWKYTNCKIGVYLGHITNACYVERKLDLDEFDESNNYKETKIFIDTQLKNFGDLGCLNSVRNTYDDILDENSLRPGKELFSKMTSLTHLGELVRIIIADLSEKEILFEGDPTEVLKIRGRFPTKYISEIECDPFDKHDRCRQILTEVFSVRHPSDDDCTNVRYICECVSKRSAHLLAAVLVNLVNRVNEDNVSIGIDGFLYMYHPFFHYYIQEKLTQFINEDVKISILLAKYGRGRGAGIAAAVARRVKNAAMKALI